MAEDENFLVMDGEKRTESEIKALVGKYQRIDPAVINDLRLWSRVDEQFGCALSHEEFAYRCAMQDMFKYIEALNSTN